MILNIPFRLFSVSSMIWFFVLSLIKSAYMWLLLSLILRNLGSAVKRSVTFLNLNHFGGLSGSLIFVPLFCRVNYSLLCNYFFGGKIALNLKEFLFNAAFGTIGAF